MIKPGEIQQNARDAGVRDQQIEKDYVLSWILQGISQHEHLSKMITFKGGTVLKKFYFKDYRFSEDLDFTLLNNNAATNEILFKYFKDIFVYIQEEVNIPLEIIDNHEYKDDGINFYISYVGPLGGHGSHKRVKVDISRSEQLEFEPVFQLTLSGYSDQESYQLLCYSLEEVLVEKMRSVMQRMQARDFYDIWYLLEMHGLEIDFYLKEFAKKCTSKGLNPAEFRDKLAQRLPQYKGRWQKSLSEQIQVLPDFDKVERETMRQLRRISL